MSNILITSGALFKYFRPHTGSVQSFTVPQSGTYKIECWGAQGGTISGFTYPNGGLGGYTSGDISLNKGKDLYIYVGQEGSLENEMFRTFNGGGIGAANDGACSSGGGETDIRVIGGVYSDFNSIKSRIMVAGGGGGCERNHLAGAAGGLVAYNSSSSATLIVNQTYGYRLMFGEDADLGPNASGAGGGYMGGITGDKIGMGTNMDLASSGGSSFISGHDGCNAIDYNKTTIGTRLVKSVTETYDICVFTNQNTLSVDNVSYTFDRTSMVDGKGYSWTNSKGSFTGMPSPSGGTEIGNSGNGYAIITLLP